MCREWTFNYYPVEDADAMGCEAPGFDDSTWSAVAIPHTWMTYETTRELHPFMRNASEKDSSYWWNGWGWYRKHFSVNRSQTGRKVFIEFDGVQKYCKLWMNGNYIGDHKGGYSSFSLDITDHVRFGEDNVLALAVNDRQADSFHIPPMAGGDWDVYGGIYRNVRLVITNPLYIPFQGSSKHEGGTFITTPKVSTARAEVRVKTWVKNEYAEPKSCELSTRIVDANGKVVLTLRSQKTIQPGELVDFDQTQTLSNPRLWSTDAPYLYTARSQVHTDGKVTDVFHSTFGVRSIGWRFGDTPESNTLLLNEKPVDLQGFCRAEEYPWLGDALPAWIQELDMHDMKVNLGCNVFRSDHYTADASVYDYCDRHGMMVVEDVPNTKNEDFSREVQEQQVREMIRRHRNRPSIFAWCMGDETNRAADSKWAHEEDTTRYIHTRDCPGPAEGNFITLPSKDLRLGRLMSCTIRGWYDRDEFSFEPVDHQSTSNEERQHRSYLAGNISGNAQAVHIGMRNMIVWLYADFSCFHSYYQNQPVLNLNPKGWVDLYRFPKFAYYLWQANHIAAPMVFIHPQFWRTRYIGQKRDFTVDSNCDAVELKINGKSFGVLKPSAENLHVVTFKGVPVEDGTLTAVGTKSGKAVETKVVMAGESARIVLTAVHGKLEAALDTVVIINADIVDAKGDHVYGATNTVHWSVVGPATLVGAPVYESDIHKNMEMNGTMYIDMPVANVIRSTGKPGLVKVRLQAAGLAMGEISLLMKEPASATPGPISQSPLATGKRQPVKCNMAEPKDVPAPEELKTIGKEIRLTARSREEYAREVSELLLKANPGLDPKTPEFAALVQVLARQLSLNGGRVSAEDFAFNAANYNRCRQFTEFVGKALLPPAFKADLQAFYCEDIIANGNTRLFEGEMDRLTAIPANSVLVKATKSNVKQIVSGVRPDFNNLDPGQQDSALVRLREINPFIRRDQLITGGRKEGGRLRTVSFTIAPGRWLLVPEIPWLLQGGSSNRMPQTIARIPVRVD